jgi:hypothetical protein
VSAYVEKMVQVTPGGPARTIGCLTLHRKADYGDGKRRTLGSEDMIGNRVAYGI